MIIENFIDNLYKELNQFKENYSEKQLSELSLLIQSALKNGNRVHISGIGKPSYVAKYAASLLSSTGIPTYFLDGTEAIHGSAGQVLPNDIVILISNSGETVELIATLQTLKNNGAITIALTGNNDSYISQTSDYSLFAGVSHEGDPLNKPPRTSIIIELIVIQLLSLVLQSDTELEMEQYLRWHPGGAIGKTK